MLKFPKPLPTFLYINLVGTDPQRLYKRPREIDLFILMLIVLGGSDNPVEMVKQIGKISKAAPKNL